MNELELAYDYWKNSTFNGYSNPHTRLMKAIVEHVLIANQVAAFKTNEMIHTESFTKPECFPEQMTLPTGVVEHKQLGIYLTIVEFTRKYPFVSGTHMRKMCRFDTQYVSQCTMRVPGRKKGEYLLHENETIMYFINSNKYKTIKNRLQAMIKNEMIVL